MNKPSRVIASFGLILLWSFTAGVDFSDALQGGSQSPRQPEPFSIEAPHWFTPPFRAEQIFSGFGASSISFLKSQLQDLIISRHALEARITCRISDYISQSRVILSSLSTTDIIFPFHHFW